MNAKFDTRTWTVFTLIVLGMYVERAQAQPAPNTASAPLTEQDRKQRIAEINRLNDEGKKLWDSGKAKEALKIYQKRLELVRVVLGDRQKSMEDTLTFLAMLAEECEEWATAREVLEERITFYESQSPRQDWRIANARRTLADLNRHATMNPARRQELKRASELKKTGRDLYRKAEYQAALQTQGQAVKIFQEIEGEEHPAYASALNDLGLSYEAVGDFVQAERLLVQQVEISRKARGEADPEYATGLNNLAKLYEEMRDYPRAEPLLRQAVLIKQKAFGAADPNCATALNNLGSLYTRMGEYARAEPLLRQALEIQGKALGESHHDYARSLGSLGTLYKKMGDFARAEPLLLQDLEITKKAVRETHPEYSTVLNNLASVYVAMGTRDNSRKDLVRAEPLFRQALDIKRKVYGETHPSYAVGLKNLASFYVSLGAFDHNSKEFARAEPLLRQALEIERKTLAADHPANASGLHSLAYISMQIGDYGRAEPLYRQVLELEKKSHGEKHPKYIEDVSQLALLYHAMGDDTRALPLFRQVLDLQDVLTRDTSGSVGERQRLRMFADRRYFLDSLVSVILDSGGSPGEVYSRILDWKGVVSAGLADDRLSRDQPELAPILAELFQVRGRLANMAFESPVATQRTTWKRQFDELFTRKEGLEADLAARSATYRQSRQSPNPDQVSAALAEGSVLIDLFEYKYHSRAERGQLHPHCGSRLLACVVRPGRPVAVVSLGSTPPVEKAVREWRKAITEHRAEALRAASAELGKLVWEPLRPHLEGVRTALISPDGALTAFPFAALPGSRPGSYLIEDLAIGYVASGRQLVESRATSDTVGRGLLAVGGVDFQAEPGRPPAAPSPSFAMRMSGPVLTQRGGFVDLPGTAAEALAVRQAFSTAFPDQPAERLTGTRASETELKRRLDGGHVKVLHLATHGFFESPARVAVLRAHARAEGGLDLPDLGGKDADDSAAFALTPLLRSGVVLAGGGRKFEPEDLSADAPVRDDGILTAEEVQALDLRGCELVVLSACETGLGDLERGQGVMGLQRAFQAAGARAVVASLWKVDDTATAVLMERFYTHLWAEKLPRLEALRQAQLDVLRNPSLTTRRTQQSPRGISPTAEPLKSGGTVESTKSAMMGRCDPALWAAFLLSGDAS